MGHLKHSKTQKIIESNKPFFPKLPTMKQTIFTLTVLFFSFLSFAAQGEELRFLAANIWGDYFGNPVEGRDASFTAVFKRYDPDLIALQEVTPNWWKSSLFKDLAADYGVIGADEDPADYVPLLYKKSRLELLESGFDAFDLKLDRSKRMTWAVLKVRKSGKTFIAFSTHYWWKGGPENDSIRLTNSQMIASRLEKLQAKWNCPAIGGGDLNSRPGSDAHKLLNEKGFFSAQEIADSASPEASHHGDPVKGPDGKYHGTPRKTGNVKANSIDHIFVEKAKIHVKTMRVILDQDALDVSDHSPIYTDFELK